MPRFRILPGYLRYSRVYSNNFARFYGLYLSSLGKAYRFSFQVQVAPSMSKERLSQLIRLTVGRLKIMSTIPQHRQGQVFKSFQELFKVPWFRVRRLVKYRAGVVYER